MQTYFDIHCHILPEVDDGARDLEETRQMLTIAYDEGFRMLVATPHFNTNGKNIDTNDLIRIYEDVKNYGESTWQDFYLLLGNELLYSSDLIEALRRGDALTINRTRYILVEFQIGTPFKDIREGLNRCIYAGYIPILAHAERYQCFIQDYKRVSELVNLGVYIQINIISMKNRWFHTEAKLCRKYLDRGWVHFLSTDAHDARRRTPRISVVIKYLTRIYGEENIQRLLWDNPLKILKNKYI